MYVVLVYDISQDNNGQRRWSHVFKSCKKDLSHKQAGNSTRQNPTQPCALPISSKTKELISQLREKYELTSPSLFIGQHQELVLE